MTTSTPTTGAGPEATTSRRSALWLVLVAAGCGGLAVVCLALGTVGLAAGGPGEEDLQGIAVPGDGTFVVDDVWVND